MTQARRLVLALSILSMLFAGAGVYSLAAFSLASKLRVNLPWSQLISDIDSAQDIAVVKKACLLITDSADKQSSANTDLAWWGLGALALFAGLAAAISLRTYVWLTRVERSAIAQGHVASLGPPKSSIMSALASGISGKLQLWKAFWLIYIPAPVLVAVLLLGLQKGSTAVGLIQTGTVTDFIVVSIILSAVLLTNLASAAIAWRCAGNSKRKFWSPIVRGVVVLNILLPLAKAVLLWSRFG